MIKELTLEDVSTGVGDDSKLVLFNDHVNTFDFVIKSLIEVCEHTPEQAEQCTIIVHYKGKYPVKKGDKEDIENRCQALLDRGLTAEVQ